VYVRVKDGRGLWSDSYTTLLQLDTTVLWP
jgi:hypothetical protein